ncbi:MAG: hypothetical protein ACFCU7_10340 [Pleurocapsa sp.]
MIDLNISIFILFLAFVYLLIIYGLLKIAEIQNRHEDIIADNSQDTSQRIKIP